MNWDAIGALGEIIGATAVGITLIYLSLQIKQVKKDLHVSGVREVNKFFIDASESITPELARVIAKNSSGDSLENWESILLDEYFFRFMTTLEVAWEHSGSDTIEVSHDVALTTLKWYMQKPGLEQWWHRNRNGFFDPWRSIVDEHFSA
jgi:hypothetical protein